MHISQEIIDDSECHFDVEFINGTTYFTIKNEVLAQVFWVYWWAKVGSKAFQKNHLAPTLAIPPLTSVVMIDIQSHSLILPPKLEAILEPLQPTPLLVIPTSSTWILSIYIILTLLYIMYLSLTQRSTHPTLHVCVSDDVKLDSGR